MADIYEDETVQIHLNGYPLEISDHYEEPRKDRPGHASRGIKSGGYWFEALVDAPPLREGLNYIVVSPGKGCLGSAASTVENVQLWVRHK